MEASDRQAGSMENPNGKSGLNAVRGKEKGDALDAIKVAICKMIRSVLPEKKNALSATRQAIFQSVGRPWRQLPTTAYHSLAWRSSK